MMEIIREASGGGAMRGCTGAFGIDVEKNNCLSPTLSIWEKKV
jgi:hypothetical protein